MTENTETPAPLSLETEHSFGVVPAGTEVLSLPPFASALFLYPDGTLKAFSPVVGLVEVRRITGRPVKMSSD